MYSIQNFAKWLNGRGVNGYKKFSKIIQIPNGEYVGFYVANVSSSAIGTTTFYKILGVWSMEGALPRCNNSSSISIDVSVSKNGRVELVDITVDEERQHIGIGSAGLSYLKEFLSFVVDGYTKFTGICVLMKKLLKVMQSLLRFIEKTTLSSTTSRIR